MFVTVAGAFGQEDYSGNLTLSLGDKTAVNSIQIPAGETVLHISRQGDGRYTSHGKVALDPDTLIADD